MTPEAQSLIEGLLNPDPEKRLGFRGVEEIKNHPWFKGNARMPLLQGIYLRI